MMSCTEDFPEWEDPIVAEVRKVRQEIFARFNYDLDAYFEHLKAVEEEDRRRGVRFSDRPLAQPRMPAIKDVATPDLPV
jgi:hypothetical protein